MIISSIDTLYLSHLTLVILQITTNIFIPKNIFSIRTSQYYYPENSIFNFFISNIYQSQKLFFHSNLIFILSTSKKIFLITIYHKFLFQYFISYFISSISIFTTLLFSFSPGGGPSMRSHWGTVLKPFPIIQ